MEDAAQPSGPDDGSNDGTLSDRDRIIAALMTLLASTPFEDIDYADIAAQAGVSLATLRAEFDSTFAILAAYIAQIDQKVLAGGDDDIADETPRERLFEVLMRRLEAMQDARPAIRSLMRSARRHPSLALAMGALAVKSQRWMLTAAGIGSAGPRGVARAQGLAVLFAGVLRTFLHDEDEGLAPTMAALDRALSRGERWSPFLDDLFRFAPRAGALCRLVPRAVCGPRRRRPTERGPDPGPDLRPGEDVVAF